MPPPSPSNPRELRRRQLDVGKNMEIIRDDKFVSPDSEEEVTVNATKKVEEIFVPKGEVVDQTTDLDPGKYTRPFHRIRWRSSACNYEEPASEQSELNYHFTVRDEKILKDLNVHKPVITREELRKCFDTWEKSTGISRILIDHSVAIEAVQKRGLTELPAYVLNECYASWCRRREENSKKPLLRNFWAVGTQGEEPQGNQLRVNFSKLRLRRQRRNSEALLNRAKDLHRECLSVLNFANTLYTRERLQRQRIWAARAQSAVQAKRKDAVHLTQMLKNDVSAFKEEQKQMLLKEDLMSRSIVGNNSSMNSSIKRRKLVYVTDDTQQSSGGMLGGSLSRKQSIINYDQSNKPKEYSNRPKLRLRQDKYGILYLDRSYDQNIDKQQPFLPSFAQYDTFNILESKIPNNNSTHLDEMLENLKTLKAVIGIPNTLPSEDSMNRLDLSQAFQQYLVQ
jgi:sulfur transfer complex TusBCD TusB component (DsrH family)